jgi:hypothetical protein
MLTKGTQCHVVGISSNAALEIQTIANTYWKTFHQILWEWQKIPLHGEEEGELDL